MGKPKLTRLDLPIFWAILLKVVCALVCVYFAYDVFIDLSREYIIRRGNTYTLQEDPVSFYVNIAKRVVFIVASLYLAVWGIRGVSGKTPK